MWVNSAFLPKKLQICVPGEIALIAVSTLEVCFDHFQLNELNLKRWVIDLARYPEVRMPHRRFMDVSCTLRRLSAGSHVAGFSCPSLMFHSASVLLPSEPARLHLAPTSFPVLLPVFVFSIYLCFLWIYLLRVTFTSCLGLRKFVLKMKYTED